MNEEVWIAFGVGAVLGTFFGIGLMGWLAGGKSAPIATVFETEDEEDIDWDPRNRRTA